MATHSLSGLARMGARAGLDGQVLGQRIATRADAQLADHACLVGKNADLGVNLMNISEGFSRFYEDSKGLRGLERLEYDQPTFPSGSLHRCPLSKAG